MSQKLTKAAAQKQILEDAGRLSQALLHHENACFAHIERAFRRRIPEVTHKTVRGVRDNHDLRESWVDLHTQSVNACEAHVVNLARYSADRAVTSIRRELQLAEQTMAAKYDGLANAVVEKVNTGKHIQDALGSWRGAVHDLRAAYRREQTHALSQADDIEDLVARLFAEHRTPRGIWWQSVTNVQQWSRWVSIWTANTVRVDAMKRFNADG